MDVVEYQVLSLVTNESWVPMYVNMTSLVTSLVSDDVQRHGNNESSETGYVINESDKQRVIIIAVLMAFTIIGNMTLIFVLLCKSSRRSKRVNILLVNLAFGDLAVAICVNSTEILFLAFGDWALGQPACKISVYVQMICLSSATNLLTTMSIDRYQVIVKPMQSLAGRSWIWLKISVSWTLSLLFPLPQLFIFVQYDSGLKPDGSPRRVCGSRGYTATWQRKLYFSYTTAYILVVPMLIMLYCYLKIIQVVWIRARSEARPSLSSTTHCPAFKYSSVSHTSSRNSCSGRNDSHSHENHTPYSSVCQCKVTLSTDARTTSTTLHKSRLSSSQHSYRKRSLRRPEVSEAESNPSSPRISVRHGLITSAKRRVLIMTLSVVVSFLVCHTPYFCINLVRIYSDYALKLEMAEVLSEFMVLVHSCLNPLLYGLFALREHHLKYVFSLLTCRRHTFRHPGRRGYHFDERHELLTSVRSRMVSFSHDDHSSPSVVTTSCNNNNSNLGSRPQTGHIPAASAFEPEHSCSHSASETSIIDNVHTKPLLCFPKTTKSKKKCNSDPVLVLNLECGQSEDNCSCGLDQQVLGGRTSKSPIRRSMSSTQGMVIHIQNGVLS